MAKALGYIQPTESGDFEGTIAMGLNSKIKFVRNTNKKNEREPDFRIYADRIGDIGGGWNKVGQNSGNAYVSITFEHPMIGQYSVYANTGEVPDVDDGTLAILWNPKN